VGCGMKLAPVDFGLYTLRQGNASSECVVSKNRVRRTLHRFERGWQRSNIKVRIGGEVLKGRSMISQSS
jgi:hypothetical protein